MKKVWFVRLTTSLCLIVLITAAVRAQQTDVLWEPVDIRQRDLYLGPGGREFQPNLTRVALIGPQAGGNNLKYRIKDGSGREWVVKIADESQPEVAAVRLLWAIGYPTEINYIIPRMSIAKKGNYKNVRAEARPDSVKRLDRWSWTNNPFLDKNEFYGLKLMMAMLNNWDLKDENNIILQVGPKRLYAIADLGASFGRLSKAPGSRAGRSVNKPEHFAQSPFINGVRGGFLELDYKGHADHLIKGIKVEHGRWLADLLTQLSDKQIEDAFRAANYDQEEIALLARAFRNRIDQLDKATKQSVAAQ